jgi:MinD-like ATPase involved in chromosome partitioning or flagellar assembly
MNRVSSLVSSASLALLGSTSARMRELSLTNDAITASLPLSRRIGFVQHQGGGGASSTAAAVASTLATRRSGLILGVNASAGARSIAWQVGAAGGTPLSERRARARSSADASDGLATTASGLRVLDLGSRGETLTAPPSGDWYSEVTPISRFFDIVCTDWGVRPWNVDLGDVASSSHVVCVVARADRQSAEDAAALVPALTANGNSPTVVIALVDVGRTGATSVEWLSDSLGIPVVLIPHDAARAAATPAGSPTLATRTRLAYGRLAGALVTAAEVAS